MAMALHGDTSVYRHVTRVFRIAVVIEKGCGAIEDIVAVMMTVSLGCGPQDVYDAVYLVRGVRARTCMHGCTLTK